MKKSRLTAFINALLSLRTSMTDTEALTVPSFFPEWKVNTTYTTADTRLYYSGQLYHVVQAHTSQSDWTPDITPALYTPVADPSIEWPEWIQPTGSTDAYALGAKVSHNSKHWVSLYDANIWEPGVFGWEENSK